MFKRGDILIDKQKEFVCNVLACGEKLYFVRLTDNNNNSIEQSVEKSFLEGRFYLNKQIRYGILIDFKTKKEIKVD